VTQAERRRLARRFLTRLAGSVWLDWRDFVAAEALRGAAAAGVRIPRSMRHLMKAAP
jgi:hypothetical protein